MKTARLTKEDTKQILKLLKAGKVVAFPTDTVYGAAIRYDDPMAIRRLKRAKKRPESKPFPMMVADKSQIAEVAEISEQAEKLIDAFMPGAITLVMKRRESVDPEVTNGLDTIAVRMPDDDWIRDLIRKCGKALLVPSANLSGEKTALNSDEVLAQLDGRISGVVLGASKGSLSSTIVDCSKKEISILRKGPISEEEIRRIIE